MLQRQATHFTKRKANLKDPDEPRNQNKGPARQPCLSSAAHLRQPRPESSNTKESQVTAKPCPSDNQRPFPPSLTGQAPSSCGQPTAGTSGRRGSATDCRRLPLLQCFGQAFYALHRRLPIPCHDAMTCGPPPRFQQRATFPDVTLLVCSE
ncbi:hypothetical protein N657DRAFT_91040 [Parathielavia appendiculata]|uniref:Uncharacterized protein n=1 Tax=Parathielavia appendiculata TaxID=2587402 RepID=A0AAN6UBF8_9PEZI|nr:hypothetical protein N657DRAFT_91040 [Parathielavia appendiculata]